MYSKEEDTPKVVEVEDNGLRLDLNLEDGLADPYLKL